MMAIRLGITPTFHLSCRLRLLRLESLRQSAVSQLRNAPPGPPRPGLWRRSVAAIASDDKSSPLPQKKRYDLSSGFLRPRESRNLDEEEAAVDSFRDSKPSPDDDDSDGDWRQPRGSQDARGSREFGSRREEEDLDDEVGDWMGTAEPSKNFRSSSLYTDARSARYSPLSPSSSKPKQARNPKPRNQAMQETVPSSPPPRDDDATYVPPVIKPEQPYIYSYSETPKVAPVGFREAVYSPFGPEGVSRPWTGRPPLAKSKKAPREFDSFNPPPQGKKGVKPVQQPGPFPEGQGPALGRSREEIMGAPLTDAEVKELVARAQKEDRQLNLGRDGLTHNMLDLIHQHWKRRRVCKIKCKGVPTVDMDNVCNVLEEKSGGKIILRAGGVVYLFRGRNYNYKTRPIIPLMLWKPPAPIYPKLIEKTPAGLTVEEANELRKLGRKLAPICHLGKNGVYLNLVRDVKNAFRADDLVKVDCKRMNPSDYKKIGAKLKDLVPCVLLSFEHESILMWKGPKSQADKPDGIDQDNSGEEAVTPFRQELPEDGKELLEQTLSQDDSEMLAAEEDIDQYDDDTDAESDHDIESAYQSEDEESQEEEVDTEAESSYNDRDEAEAEAEAAAERAESSYNNSDEGEAEAEAAAERAGFSYEVRDEVEAEGDKAAAERAERAIAEFESRWQEALSSSEALVLEEQQVEDPDAVFEVVKSQFGGPYGAPSKPRNKRNSNELVGKKALRNSAPRLDSSVLDRVPKDPSGLLEIDELAKLLAP